VGAQDDTRSWKALKLTSSLLVTGSRGLDEIFRNYLWTKKKKIEEAASMPVAAQLRNSGSGHSAQPLAKKMD